MVAHSHIVRYYEEKTDICIHLLILIPKFTLIFDILYSRKKRLSYINVRSS